METVVTPAMVWNTLRTVKQKKISHEVSFDVSKVELGAYACKFGALTAGPQRFVSELLKYVRHVLV